MQFDEVGSRIPDIITSTSPMSGSVAWTSPSNIAIIKYWGKYGRQLPKNPSISFTLNTAKTTTKINYKTITNPDGKIRVNFLFEEQENKKFGDKIIKFFTSILDVLPFLDQLEFDISSSNSFPHSAGIASSASAMSAIACCLCSIENQLQNKPSKEISLYRASYLARLGSGSACRSLFPVMSVWGTIANTTIPSSNLHGIPYQEDVAEVFKQYHDDILIVSKAEKSVSSTAGHQLMESNVYASARYTQANNRLIELLKALKNGDQKTFGKIAEEEALTLHALMMSSEPSYLLMHPNTLEVINKVRAFRKKTNEHLYFTLDAGPNVHLLYPDSAKAVVQIFIEQELRPLCEDGMIIRDTIGLGAKIL